MASAPDPTASSVDTAASAADRKLILDFANTLDVEAATDDLVTRAQLSAFLRQSALGDGSAPTEEDVALARDLRSGIRLALQLNHDEVSDDVPELDRVLARLPMRLSWSAGGPTLEPVEAGVAGSLAQIAVAVANAHADGRWERLKICADSACQEAYYDASKNRSKNWCGPTCGNKAKTRAYRRRTKNVRD